MDFSNNEAQASATQPSSTTARGQRGGRGARGVVRGARGRGGRGRGASTNAPRTPLISRDVLDGNHPNYRQTPDGQLYRSIHGHPLCNYCGGPSHKRQNCTVKAADREAGMTRVNHPDRDKMVASQDKARIAAAATLNKELPALNAAAMSPFPMAQPMAHQQYNPWHYMSPPPMAQIPSLQWQTQPTLTANAAKMEMTPSNQQEHVSSSMTPKVCPYITCQTILSDQNQAQEHMQKFHSTNNILAPGPGARP